LQLFLLLASIAILSWVTYEDLRYRAVTWWCFPVLFLLLSAQYWLSSRWQDWFPILLLNIGFVSVQLALVSLYFSLKHRKWVLLTNGFLGLGDVLFFICFCGAMSTPFFVAFYITSLIGSLLLSALIPPIRKNGIPLAGLQALFLIPVLVYSYVQGINLTEESVLIVLVNEYLTTSY
jgi:hypothetical protein